MSDEKTDSRPSATARNRDMAAPANAEIIESGISGQVKWYSLRRRYGFIERNDGKPDVFVHQTAIAKSRMIKVYLRTLRNGERVVFDVVNGIKGPQAAELTGPNGAEVRGSPHFMFQFYRYRQMVAERRMQATEPSSLKESKKKDVVKDRSPPKTMEIGAGDAATVISAEPAKEAEIAPSVEKPSSEELVKEAEIAPKVEKTSTEEPVKEAEIAPKVEKPSTGEPVKDAEIAPKVEKPSTEEPVKEGEIASTLAEPSTQKKEVAASKKKTKAQKAKNKKQQRKNSAKAKNEKKEVPVSKEEEVTEKIAVKLSSADLNGNLASQSVATEKASKNVVVEAKKSTPVDPRTTLVIDMDELSSADEGEDELELLEKSLRAVVIKESPKPVKSEAAAPVIELDESDSSTDECDDKCKRAEKTHEGVAVFEAM